MKWLGFLCNLYKTINFSVLLKKVAVIDPNSYGYYRVLYNTKHYKEITRILNANPNNIEKMGRTKLIGDAFSFQRHDLLTTEPYEIATYIRNDTLEFPITLLSSNLRVVEEVLSNTDHTNVSIFFK